MQEIHEHCAKMHDIVGNMLEKYQTDIATAVAGAKQRVEGEAPPPDKSWTQRFVPSVHPRHLALREANAQVSPKDFAQSSVMKEYHMLVELQHEVSALLKHERIRSYMESFGDSITEEAVKAFDAAGAAREGHHYGKGVLTQLDRLIDCMKTKMEYQVEELEHGQLEPDATKGQKLQ